MKVQSPLTECGCWLSVRMHVQERQGNNVLDNSAHGKCKD